MTAAFCLLTGTPPTTADQSVVAFSLQLSALSFQLSAFEKTGLGQFCILNCVLFSGI
jgi:hypothetical protein